MAASNHEGLCISEEELNRLIINIVHEILRHEMSNGWSDWSKSVLNNLDDLNEKYRRLSDNQHQMQTSFEVLKAQMAIKSGLWGATAGVIAVVFAIVMYFLKGILN